MICMKWKYFLVDEKSTAHETNAQCTSFYNQGTASGYSFHIDRNEHHRRETFRRKDVNEEE